MASTSPGQDNPPYPTAAPSEASRFSGNAAIHGDPEKASSGNLPTQPTGLDVEATFNGHTPFRGMSNGR